jgi:putative holliday junction resolvase
MARTMGLDVGDSRIGVALSDPLGILASPLTIVTRGDIEADIPAILAIARQHDVGSIVIGLPRNMDGSEGGQVTKVRGFADGLKQRTDLPIILQDERLSTVEAMRLFKESGKTGRGTRYDAAAAAVILQSYLDDHATPRELPPD